MIVIVIVIVIVIEHKCVREFDRAFDIRVHQTLCFGSD
jgi:hypothetical protein